MRQVLYVLVLVAVAVPAGAQPAPWQAERITAGWVFTPSIVFGTMWDTNVTIRNENNPTTSELVGLVNPRGEIDFNGRRAKFTAGYSGSLEAYRELDELTRYDQRGRLEARYQMTPRLGFNTRQTMTISPTTEQLQLGGLPFTRVGSRLFDAVGGFTYDVTPRAKLTTSYNFQWVNFDRAAESAPDFVFLQGGHAHSPSAELLYQLSRRLDVGASYAYRHTSIDGDEQIFDSQDMRGVVHFDLGPSTSIRGSAGVSYVSVARTGENRTGPSFGAGISHTARQVSMSASYERSFLPSYGFGSLSATESLHAGVATPLASGRMYAGTGFTWRRTEPAVEQGLNIRLDSYWWNSSFGFHLTRWLRAEAFYALTHQLSDAQGNIDRTRVGIQFVTSKPVRIQ
jgi:uncharacterized protein (PEP-CTERM system associated)